MDGLDVNFMTKWLTIVFPSGEEVEKAMENQEMMSLLSPPQGLLGGGPLGGGPPEGGGPPVGGPSGDGPSGGGPSVGGPAGGGPSGGGSREDKRDTR
ncbi:hypothetical protein MSG28_013380 [Choristoneura fumiferana]|uniref:Uncharacterized protein n=1 Tax=Choristoneura fumiferana TaxID=7141 RepID=A0ACC0KU39_CHOFU|nr:hypothetical protein MSG28_013380 [Choristoneura fumiferana]